MESIKSCKMFKILWNFTLCKWSHQNDSPANFRNLDVKKYSLKPCKPQNFEIFWQIWQGSKFETPAEALLDTGGEERKE